MWGIIQFFVKLSFYKIFFYYIFFLIPKITLDKSFGGKGCVILTYVGGLLHARPGIAIIITGPSQGRNLWVRTNNRWTTLSFFQYPGSWISCVVSSHLLLLLLVKQETSMFPLLNNECSHWEDWGSHFVSELTRGATVQCTVTPPGQLNFLRVS